MIFVGERIPRREAFLDYFLRLSREGDDKWSDEELRDEVSTLMVAVSNKSKIPILIMTYGPVSSTTNICKLYSILLLCRDVDFISQGYDSTSFTNSFVLLMLASHPDIQVRICTRWIWMYNY